MYLSKVLKVIVLLSLLALVIPLSMVQGQIPIGTAVIRDSSSGLSDSLVMDLSGLPSLSDTEAYEAWLVSDDGSDKLSLGVLAVSASGTASQTFTHATGMNLATGYSHFVITIEPVPDTDPMPSGVISHADMLPAEGLAHIRGLLDNDSGATVQLMSQTAVALMHAKFAVDAKTLEELQAHTGHVINIIEGSEGENYDEAAGNPGDGAGVGSHAAAASEMAAAASAAVPTSFNFQTYMGDVSKSADNAANWSAMAKDMALTADSTDSMTTAHAFATNAHTLLNRALNGWDEDRNGEVGATEGEGGAMQAHVGAQNMATYNPSIPVEPPDTGDINFATLALIALGAGAVLILGGGAFFRHSRARA
jgi:hypothetical protein